MTIPFCVYRQDSSRVIPKYLFLSHTQLVRTSRLYSLTFIYVYVPSVNTSSVREEEVGPLGWSSGPGPSGALNCHRPSPSALLPNTDVRPRGCAARLATISEGLPGPSCLHLLHSSRGSTLISAGSQVWGTPTCLPSPPCSLPLSPLVSLGSRTLSGKGNISLMLFPVSC